MLIKRERVLKIVPGMGLEPTRLTTHGPQPCLSTNFSTRVNKKSLLKDFELS